MRQYLFDTKDVDNPSQRVRPRRAAAQRDNEGRPPRRTVAGERKRHVGSQRAGSMRVRPTGGRRLNAALRPDHPAREHGAGERYASARQAQGRRAR
eukprot:7376046-Prymnesium_polylepis.2